MLYDPKWEKQAEQKADPYSLARLIAWLERQPADGPYRWTCIDGGCLIGIYAEATNINFFECHGAFYRRKELGPIASRMPWTFGAALERAKVVAGG